MDLFNNEIGRNIVFNGFTNLLLMHHEVLNALNDGDLGYLTNQNQNVGQEYCRATFSSQLIPTNQ